MANCKYCGKPAGLFRDKHAECEHQHEQHLRAIQAGRQQIVAEAVRALASSTDFDGLETKLAQIEQASFVPAADRKALLIKAWEDSVELFLADSILDADEEKRLVEFKSRFGLSQSELDANGALTRTAKAAVLRDILNGIIPHRVSLDDSFPINFQKGEQVAWAFPGSQYLEDKTRRGFVGRSEGISVRVMKGVYYRVGAFKGHPVEHTERVHTDTGSFVVTDKNVYFAGSRKSFRIPYTKIVSFTPFSDGVGLMRDAATAKAQVFVTGDGWFTYNLLMNLSRM